MAIKTEVIMTVTEWYEALYLMYTDPKNEAPEQAVQGGKVVWRAKQTKAAEKALKELRSKKNAPKISLDMLTPTNLKKIGVTVEAGGVKQKAAPTAGKKTAPRKATAKKTTARKSTARKTTAKKTTAKKTAATTTQKRRGPKKGGKLRRLDESQKKWIMDEAKKGKGQTAIQKAFQTKYNFRPSYATVNKYVRSAKK